MVILPDAARFSESLFEQDLQNIPIEMKNDIDQLYNELSEYRNIETFHRIIDFCASFRHIAPFNALLIHMQLPGCRYALTANQWRHVYGRKLKPDARPLFYLNMTPVGALYDISHTLPIHKEHLTDQDILDKVARPFKGQGEFDNRLLNNLLSNLAFYGIACDLDFVASERFAAYICKYEKLGKVHTNYQGVDCTFDCSFPYYLGVNKSYNNLERFQSVCHELGHFFCHHLPPQTKDWWDQRPTDSTIREFEAEITAYLVCKRQGVIPPNSGEYLSDYVANHDEIPHNCSIKAIMNAVSEIEKMLIPVDYTSGYLYKYDERFRKQVQEAHRRIDNKMKRSKKGRLFLL